MSCFSRLTPFPSKKVCIFQPLPSLWSPGERNILQRQADRGHCTPGPKGTWGYCLPAAAGQTALPSAAGTRLCEGTSRHGVGCFGPGSTAQGMLPIPPSAHFLLAEAKGDSSLLDSALIQQVVWCPSGPKGLQSIDKMAKRLHKARWAEENKKTHNTQTNKTPNQKTIHETLYKQTKKNFCSLAK